MARFAASFNRSGAAKSGKPCARLTAPHFRARRVISRMTDSVKNLVLDETSVGIEPSLLDQAKRRPTRQGLTGSSTRTYRIREKPFDGGWKSGDSHYPSVTGSPLPVFSCSPRGLILRSSVAAALSSQIRGNQFNGPEIYGQLPLPLWRNSSNCAAPCCIRHGSIASTLKRQSLPILKPGNWPFFRRR